ncbi:ACT domain protein [Shimia sp. SK013]|uniref:ACT domain-containing protein n=1 Tax=Shimia sp. SK013 TaxID=1389006 RepID=UPI0006B41F60|nr:ACT domain-containing protein [Shimia sp. SK013]KPA22966.1 ACT domain protein [Shimia sp. SK013]
MVDTAKTAFEMISGMNPELKNGLYVFTITREKEVLERLLPEALCLYREAEGLSMILPVAVAAREGFDTDQPMRCITLNVYSALEGVGLTAAVATELAAHGIACNMVAAYHHDHAFVPAAQAENAVRILKSRQQAEAAGEA